MLAAPPEELLEYCMERVLLGMLNLWVLERRANAEGVGLVATVLRLLLKIPLKTFRPVRLAGLHDTLRVHCEHHEQKSVCDLAVQVAKKWTALSKKTAQVHTLQM